MEKEEKNVMMKRIGGDGLLNPSCPALGYGYRSGCTGHGGGEWLVEVEGGGGVERRCGGGGWPA